MEAMQEEYGAKKGKSVFYASANKGTISGVEPAKTKKAKSGRKSQKKRKMGMAAMKGTF